MLYKKSILVSVIVPVYNTVLYINDCILSIINQTYKDIEIIIVDDGSMDGSDIICESFIAKDDRIKYIRQNNCGVVRARLTGIQHAIGEYILFVDSDDWIDPEMIEFLLYQMCNADLITTGVKYEIQKDIVTEYMDKYSEGFYSGQGKEKIWNTMLFDVDSDELQRLTPWICNKLYRSSIVKEIFEKLDTSMKFAEDAVFLYRYVLRCRSIVISHQCFYHYRYREESAFHKENPYMLIDINKAYLELVEDFNNHSMSESLMAQLQRWIAIMSFKAVNERMGFKTTVNIPEFLLDTDGLKNKRIVLYGAGKMGKDYYSQLSKMGYRVVLWVDANPSESQVIKAPNAILTTEFDIILIAVSREEYVEGIVELLKKFKISSDKILWKIPIRLG